MTNEKYILSEPIMNDPVLCLNELHSHLLISAKPDRYDKIGISKHADTRVEGNSVPIYV